MAPMSPVAASGFQLTTDPESTGRVLALSHQSALFPLRAPGDFYGQVCRVFSGGEPLTHSDTPGFLEKVNGIYFEGGVTIG